MASTKLEDGYWKKWTNVESTLKGYIAEYGAFPTSADLRKAHMSSAARAISLFHGGMYHVAQKMGYESKQGPKNVWKNFERVREVLTQLEKEKGHFPTADEIRLYNAALLRAIHRHHGKIEGVRKKMQKESMRKNYGHWISFENVELELTPVINHMGRFPTRDELVHQGYGKLLYAIAKHHKGLRNVRKKMGYEEIRRESGYWESWDNVKRELVDVCANLGHFPTSQELRSSGHHDLASAIFRHHGTLIGVRDKLANERAIPSDNVSLQTLLEKYAGGNDGEN